jgi:dihydrolipoamide dehydrogenase
MSDQQFDVVVIGGGPGGYVAAIRASQLGMKTALVEREHLGGICLNWGCIPTKALLRTSEIYHLFNHASDFGLSADNVKFDLSKIVARSRGVAKQLSTGVGFLMKKHKITVIEGTAKLTRTSGTPKVDVTLKKGGQSELTAKHIIIATGARARTLPQAGLEPDGKVIWTYREAMVPETMPQKLLVIGSGAIGIEFASFYRTLGAQVTVVEMMDRILPVEDAEISAFARKSFEKQGMVIHTSTQVKAVKATANGAAATLADAKGKETTLEIDKVILAIGIVGNTDHLGLEEVGVKVERSHIVTGEGGSTGVPGVWAIGDVCGAPWLAHKASHEAIICVETIAGGHAPHPLNIEAIPGCTYCHPQIASVGLTEARAKETGRKLKIGRFPYIGNGKAIALGDAEGLVKTIFDAETGELIGAHMIGAEVTELIQGFSIAKAGELTEAELMETVFPHPTLSEMMHESVLDAYGRALHI